MFTLANSCGGFVDSFTDTGVRSVLHLPLGTSLYYYMGGSVSNVGFVETQKIQKIFLDKSVGGEYNFFGQLWRVCVFLCFWDLWSFCGDRFDGLDNSRCGMVKF